MALADVLTRLATMVAALLVVSTVAFVGVRPLLAALRDSRRRVDAVAPYLLALLVVLGGRRVILRYGPSLSWVIDINLTGTIYALEGTFVATLQSYGSPAVTQVLTFSYLYAYTFLLVFPFVAYFALDDPDHLRELVAAYGVNYGVGLVCYVLFIAYGPRNVMPDVTPPLLYEFYPQSQLLTSEVNRNVNVFPSLHASLSVTVAAMALRTRDHYRGWAALACAIAAAVIFSTMYLAIHWLTDVVAGAVLGVASFYAGTNAPAVSGSELVRRIRERLAEARSDAEG